VHLARMSSAYKITRRSGLRYREGRKTQSSLSDLGESRVQTGMREKKTPRAAAPYREVELELRRRHVAERLPQSPQAAGGIHRGNLQVKLCGVEPAGFNVHHDFKLWARPFTQLPNADVRVIPEAAEPVKRVCGRCDRFSGRFRRIWACGTRSRGPGAAPAAQRGRTAWTLARMTQY
jgi:hypothetical protein